MPRIPRILLLICLCASVIYAAGEERRWSPQDFSIDNILEDIYNQLAEDGDIPMEELQEDLLDLAANPINLNQTNANELSQLRFLNDEQIDAILLYQYQHPFQDIYAGSIPGQGSMIPHVCAVLSGTSVVSDSLTL